jgi:hypothetical protein
MNVTAIHNMHLILFRIHSLNIVTQDSKCATKSGISNGAVYHGLSEL